MRNKSLATILGVSLLTGCANPNYQDNNSNQGNYDNRNNEEVYQSVEEIQNRVKSNIEGSRFRVGNYYNTSLNSSKDYRMTLHHPTGRNLDIKLVNCFDEPVDVERFYSLYDIGDIVEINPGGIERKVDNGVHSYFEVCVGSFGKPKDVELQRTRERLEYQEFKRKNGQRN